jgi:hypothetical protein
MTDSFARNWKNEYNKYARHSNFIHVMMDNKSKPIDWDCYWSWYHHSNCTPEEALKNSKKEKEK